tara:strand:+ start:2548 stop:2952 length:405 start_codon:yes stop_codon:yes gene_type:complete
MNIINRTNNNLMFDDFIFDFFNVSNNIVPPHNIFENDTDFSLEFSVPGSDKKDFSIELEKDNLKVSRKSKNSVEDRTYSRLEFNTKSFEKHFFLPEFVDQSKITSRYENGVLLITIPKKKEIVLKNKKKSITVN